MTIVWTQVVIALLIGFLTGWFLGYRHRIKDVVDASVIGFNQGVLAAIEKAKEMKDEGK